MSLRFPRPHKQIPLWKCWWLDHRCRTHCGACICPRCIAARAYRAAALWLKAQLETNQ